MRSDQIKPSCLFIMGPTASGKTALSLELADWLHAEIISADSRQIYRHMDIGTATPSVKELSRVKHYFINELDPDEPFSAGQFGEEARRIIDEKIENGEHVIVSGGSGLYIQAVRGMISDTIATDIDIRKRIKQRGDEEGWLAVFRELQKIDPDYAAQIDHMNPQRVCRAMEIWEMTGQRPSEVLRGKEAGFPWPALAIGLDPDRRLLYERINRRVLQMVEDGLFDEVQSLLERGYSQEMNALNTVGYKEIISCLNGKIDRETAISEIQKNTRRFAKRQMTWFRKYAPDRWLSYKQEPNLGELVEIAKSMIIEEL